MRNSLAIAHRSHRRHIPVEIPSIHKGLYLSQKTALQHLLKPLSNTLMQKATVFWQHD
jgi:hypothetical protein